MRPIDALRVGAHSLLRIIFYIQIKSLVIVERQSKQKAQSKNVVKTKIFLYSFCFFCFFFFHLCLWSVNCVFKNKRNTHICWFPLQICFTKNEKYVIITSLHGANDCVVGVWRGGGRRKTLVTAMHYHCTKSRNHTTIICLLLLSLGREESLFALPSLFKVHSDCNE